ncbi:MAG TPA: ABC transporter ATP-binding protein [Bacteroidales bacterium]|nr:ABC transporter ATP-binding protein [Aminobacterium colombiense]HHV03574.1 ABC transporter ATP-binding protein [Bacteroidales bacterium]
MMGKILEIRNLRVSYETEDGTVEALNGIDLDLDEGVTLGIVGETGAGKTTLAKSIMRIIPTPPGHIESGTILYKNKDILGMTSSEIRKVRGEQVSMIFQDPMTSLNPIMIVGDQIAEAIKTHMHVSSAKATKKASEMMELVGIDPVRMSDYPHQFSGGMKQRVVIAMALACNPKVLIADEPTTALDVTIQAQVLEMMNELKKKFNMATILITHDLGIVAQTCEKAAVIYAGEIVEYGTVHEIFKNMRHPYTIGLMNSIPKIGIEENRLNPIDGLMPDPMNLPKGCNFWPRCKLATEKCKHESPAVTHIDGEHFVRCWYS